MKYFLYLVALLLTSFSLISSQQGFNLSQSMERGKQVYSTHCFTCHMEKGEGIQGVYPPLANSDYLMADKNRAIKQVLEGANGEMIVNGEKYFGFMTGFPLSDTEVSDVLNYIRNSWGNKGAPVTPAEVKALR